MKILKLPKFHWAKLLSIFFFVILLGSYINIFATGEPYAPGTMLDPSCGPLDPGCTVTISGGGGGLTSDDDFNTFGGTDAGLNLVAGAQANTGIGYQALYSNTTGYYNTANGYYSLYSNTTGYYNTANGYYSLYSNTTGSDNTANGDSSLFSNTGGSNNTANGNQSLHSNTTGNNNTANGTWSLFSNTTGNNNTANGMYSLSSNTIGTQNTANGYNSLNFNTTGNSNTANGYNSLLYNTTGSSNTANGYYSGMNIANGSTPNQTSSNSLYLGYDTRALTNGDTNEIVIGASAIGNGSNTATIGDSALLRTYLTGLNLKAGTSTAGTAPLKFTSGSLLGTTEAGAVEFYNSHLYFTAVDSGTRFQLDQQGGGGQIITFQDEGTRITDNPITTFNVVGSASALTYSGNGVATLDMSAVSTTYIPYTGATGAVNLGAYDLTVNGITVGIGHLGSWTTAVGHNALASNIANGNTAFGYNSLASVTTGPSNNAFGDYTLQHLISGGSNSAFGELSLYNVLGERNTGLGDNTLYNLVLGDSNIAVGASAGVYTGSASYLTTSNNSIFIGYDSRPLIDASTNEIVIGSVIIGHGSNTATIGNTSTLRTYLTGLNLKAGSATADTAPLKFTSGTVLGTTEAGAVEYDGTHLYFTATNNGTRFQLDQQSGGSGLSSDADFNTKGGTDAGLNLVAGAQYNTFLGYEAGKSGTGTTNAADNNTAIGYQSLYSNTTGTQNTANGMSSLFSNTTGYENTANGSYSLFSNTTGNENTANGMSSLFSNTTGYYNTANGYQSLYSNTTGYFNTANGYQSLYSNTTGYFNTANGYSSLYSNTIGFQNTANGMYSLTSNTTGNENTANGFQSLYSNTNGNNNTANGYRSLYSNTNGTYNTGIGYRAGYFISGGSTANTTGDYNVFLGSDTKALADDDQNEIVIGYNAIGHGSDTTTIGNDSTLRTYLTGLNLKAGTATAGTAPLKFTSGTVLGTTEAGAVEYDGTHLYFTAINSGPRYQLDQQGGGGGLSSDADFNTKGGTNAGLNLVAGAQYNTFLGFEAGKSGAVGGDNTADNNTAIGYQSLFSNTTGSANTANGYQSLYSNTTGDSNTANGYYSLNANTTGIGNTANGINSLRSNTTGSENTANGYQSLYSNTTGSNNTANGYSSLTSNTTGSENTANGSYSLYANTIGIYNAATGFYSLFSNTTGNYNTANGSYSLYANTIGTDNTANGYSSLTSNTTGSYNTANGYSSLFSNKANSRSTAIGYNSMYNADDRTLGQDTYNTALGYEALKGSATAANNTGQYNTAIGDSALFSNTTGNYNTANGFQSLYSNTTGGGNTANGYESLFSNTIGTDNTANGYYSLYSNTIGTENTANGIRSLSSNTTGSSNTANGMNSLGSNTTGNWNTANGYKAGLFMADGLTVNATSSNSLYLGYDTRALADGDTNEIVIGASAIGNGSNTTTIGTGNVLYVGGSSITGKVARFTNSAGYCDINPLNASLDCSSDINLKKNITTLNGEDFILNTEIDSKDKGTLEKIISLNPVTYNWNTEEDDTGKHIGFIAQEVEQLFPNLVFTDEDSGLKSISYTNFIPYTIAAIQEMDLKVKDLSSLDTESATSLGSLIKDFLGSVGNNISDLYAKVIHSDKVETKMLCVGSTCVTEDQFLEIVNKNVTTDDATKENTDDGSAITPVTPPLDTVEIPVEDKKAEEQPVIEKKTEETPAENPAPLVESTSENTD